MESIIFSSFCTFKNNQYPTWYHAIVLLMSKAFLRYIAALVLSLLCCSFAHLLADGLASKYHYCHPCEQILKSDSDGNEHSAGSHRHSHNPETPCDEWLCHCDFSSCNMLGTKTILLQQISSPASFPNTMIETLKSETIKPLRLPPRTSTGLLKTYTKL